MTDDTVDVVLEYGPHRDHKEDCEISEGKLNMEVREVNLGAFEKKVLELADKLGP